VHFHINKQNMLNNSVIYILRKQFFFKKKRAKNLSQFQLLKSISL